MILSKFSGVISASYFIADISRLVTDALTLYKGSRSYTEDAIMLSEIPLLAAKNSVSKVAAS